MGKLLKKLLIFSIPFIVLLAMFLAFEPYDYFGLKEESTYLSKPLSSMRELKREQPANIILGDSRMANLNTDYIEEISGERYLMLGFGGAQLGESIELFWYATEHTKLEKVVLGFSFYNSGGDQGSGRIPIIEELAESPIMFTGNLNYWLEAINMLKLKTLNFVGTAFNRPELIEYPEDPTTFAYNTVTDERGDRYRKDLEDFAKIIEDMCAGYSLEDKTLEQLGAVISYCEENDIELTFVFPPMHDSIFDVVDKLDIEKYREKSKEYISSRAKAIDFEVKNDFSANEDNFYDGFHLQGEQKKWLAESIFKID